MAGKPKDAPRKKLNPLAVRVDDELLEELRRIAKTEHRAVANLAVALILEALEARKRKG
jgi:hypothetical protein